MYDRLLVPLDGSRLAEAVLPVVERLAPLYGATAVLLHVLERGAPAAVHGQRHLTAMPEATAYLEGVAGRLRAQGITVETHPHEVPEGDVARSIAAHAPEERADLIVLSTHGSGGLRDLLYGSIAQQVLKRGAVPVLLARPAPDGSAPPFDPHRLLVPLDGTAAAEAALGPAEDLSRRLNAVLHLVMVVATSGTVRGEQQAVAQALPTATRIELELQEAEARDYLEDVAGRLRSGGVAVTTEVRRGDTPSALADEAAEPGVGLVVVATHGRVGVQAIWTGSVTARLLSRTRAPLLLLRMVET
ncbi:MAG TPA: universal stress protein [Chloroflexota bacterium]|nr:universal stress protein [Chloroflexota bacterium]